MFSKFLIAGLFACLLDVTTAHSWMTKPVSHNSNGGRGAETRGPCDPAHTPGMTAVTAGEELEITWPSMGHAGGHIRLAIAPIVTSKGAQADQDAFDKGVIKTICYGGGNCGTCVTNEKPYKTTVTIPTNLADGKYSLQWWAYGTGNGLPQYWSCSDLTITGGDAAQTCSVDKAPVDDTCWFCAGACDPKSTKFSPTINKQKAGQFCYAKGAAPVVTSAPTTAPASGPVTYPIIPDDVCYKKHTVVQGDTVFNIATTEGTTIQAIKLATGHEDDAYCTAYMAEKNVCPSMCQSRGQTCSACVCTGTVGCHGFDMDCIGIGHVLTVPQKGAQCLVVRAADRAADAADKDDNKDGKKPEQPDLNAASPVAGSAQTAFVATIATSLLCYVLL